MDKLVRKNDWVDPSRYLRRIFVERSCQDDAYVREILERAGLRFESINEADYHLMVEGVYPENLGDGKSVLLLSRNKGTFLKDCPSTRVYQCCGYKVINSGTGCPMDCTYCILQAYLNNPYQNFYVNLEDLFKELDAEITTGDTRFMRVGTGEFTDSMALDRITGLSRKLIHYFRDKPNCVLELKTKSAYIENLKNIDHGKRTIMAWSLNSDDIVSKEEFRAATIDERLQAAAACSSLGYDLAFHFDPIIAYPSWKEWSEISLFAIKSFDKLVMVYRCIREAPGTNLLQLRNISEPAH